MTTRRKSRLASKLRLSNSASRRKIEQTSVPTEPELVGTKMSRHLSSVADAEVAARPALGRLCLVQGRIVRVAIPGVLASSSDRKRLGSSRPLSAAAPDGCEEPAGG